ncbi:hypothetical protein KR222_009880, partial [Zaprionus bogoriensis]
KQLEDTIVTTSKQLANAAPTLPVHSPHSPVHPNSYPNIQKNKLSGRYINNKRESDSKSLKNKQWTGDNKNNLSEREVFPTSPLGKSCNCVKSPNYDKTIIHKEKCLDLRHISTKNIILKDRAFNIPKSVHGSSQNGKEQIVENSLLIPTGSFEKTSTEASLKKTVRKSPVCQKMQYEKANINLNDKPQRQSYLSAQDNQNRRPRTFTVSKSEQTSPNNIDPKNMNFKFEKNKRSTGSLLYVSSMDPWTKKNNVQINRANEMDTNPTDPWIRRSTESYVPKLRPEIKHNNSFSCTRTFFLSDAKRDTNHLQPELYSYANSRNEESVYSAPPSPHFLNMSTDCSLIRSPKKALQTKSASFSPARGKHLQNPFGDVCDDNITKSSFQTNYQNAPEQSEHNIENANCNLLHVNSSKILQNRHSFSSIAQQSKEELQLNIRRLSEQMGQMSLQKIVQLSLSDCNVNNKGKLMPTLEQQPETIDSLATHGTEKKDHKDTSKSKAIANSSQHNSKVSTVFGKKTKVYASYQKPNPMQETTC